MNVSLAPVSQHEAAARPAEAHGFALGPGLILLLVLLIAAVGYGARTSRRRRQGRVADSAWRPEGQALPPAGSGAPAGESAGKPARAPEPPSAPEPASPPGPAAPPEPAWPRAASAAALLGGPAGGWAVETHALTKRFGPNVAVNDIELLVPRGSAFGYLGPNGAGKPVTELRRSLARS